MATLQDRKRSESSYSAGLSSEQALRELGKAGPNILQEGAGPHWARRLGRNFTHLFAALLWCAAGLALLAGQPPLAAAIVLVVLVNAIFSFAQEYRAERAVAALRLALPKISLVRRDGRVREVAAADLVPGDLAGFGRAVSRLFDDPGLAAQLGRNGLERVRAQFLHDRQVADYARLVAALAG